jgi:hypothetical protein
LANSASALFAAPDADADAAPEDGAPTITAPLAAIAPNRARTRRVVTTEHERTTWLVSPSIVYVVKPYLGLAEFSFLI